MPDVRTIPADSDDALALVAGMIAAVAAAYDAADFGQGGGPSATPQDFSPPGGRFVAIYADDGITPLAGGGIKRLDAETGELKRMHVVPSAQGQGLSRPLLAALEDAARDLGYRRLRLDTGSRQPAALHLYLSTGYSEIPDYNQNPYATFWGEKDL